MFYILVFAPQLVREASNPHLMRLWAPAAMPLLQAARTEQVRARWPCTHTARASVAVRSALSVHAACSA